MRLNFDLLSKVKDKKALIINLDTPKGGVSELEKETHVCQITYAVSNTNCIFFKKKRK